MILSVFKFSAAGNIFVLVDLKNPANKTIRANAQPKLAQWLSREFATDGIIFLTQNSKLGAAPVAPQVPRALRSAKTQNLVMVFYNPDGSRAFCGNGTRTSGFYQLRFVEKRREGLVTVTTDAGLIPVAVDGNRATLLEVDTPKYLSSVKLDFSLNSSLKHATCNMQHATFYKIWSGTDHAVAFVEDVDAIDVEDVGRSVRYHDAFAPKGTNADFVQALGRGKLDVRTYERGVERETASCGSGVLASAYIARELGKLKGAKARCQTRGGMLEVCFGANKKLSLGGEVKLVFKGEAHV